MRKPYTINLSLGILAASMQDAQKQAEHIFDVLLKTNRVFAILSPQITEGIKLEYETKEKNKKEGNK